MGSLDKMLVQCIGAVRLYLATYQHNGTASSARGDRINIIFIKVGKVNSPLKIETYIPIDMDRKII